MMLRTGVDLVDIARLEDLNPAIRQRFLERVYTERELEEAAGRGENQWATLTGRFAAKEAVAKALGCGIGPVAWREIEILRGEQGEPLLKLHGEAARVSQSLGIETWSVSISHTRTQALAFAVAVGAIPSGSSHPHEDPGRQ
jgi:holo-[acyl-carrier protein] synthase